MQPRIVPWGEWESPLGAAQVVAGSHEPVEARYVGDEVWWTEPAGDGRTTLLRETGGEPQVLLPAPWNVRSAVHEYGGGAWTAVGTTAVFSHLADHRLYALDAAGAEPRPLVPSGSRYGGLVPGPAGAVLAVREVHTGEAPGDVRRELVVVPLDGSAAEREDLVRSVAAGSRFLAQPALAADGRLAWVAWDHPAMPWEATEVRVARVDGGPVRTVAGGPGESVLQPGWLPDGGLAVCSDRSGWWNLLRVDPASGAAEPVAAEARETGGPLWVLGLRWFLPLPDGRFLVTSRLGADEQRLIGRDGAVRVLRADRSGTDWQDLRGSRALLTDSAAGDPVSLWEVDADTGEYRLVRAGVDGLPREWFPGAERIVVDGVHAVLHRPHAPGVTGPPGELPPYVLTVHGGPTAQARMRLDPGTAYLTSRGIGVVDVDYGGSTGYGREYRRRLDGEWGVVDVQDVLTVAAGLVRDGVADPARLAIEGGSAGGWTVLSALTGSDVFAAGVSRYGVADLAALAADTHDFEAHYLDGLVGPWPEAADRYAERAPVNRADRLSAPVLLLQGLEDRVVPPAQSRAFRDAAAAKGIPHALVEFPGEGHGFRGRDARIRAQEATLSFLGQVLGFDPPGVPVLPLDR